MDYESSDVNMKEITTVEFNLLREYLANVSGIEVQNNKRYLFEIRLKKLLEDLHCANFSDFYNRLIISKDNILQQRLIQSMTIHETSFNRDIHPFILLEKELLPRIASLRATQANYFAPRIRIFSVGCSQGQEPYTIAMCVHQWLQKQTIYNQDMVSILAVDISAEVLQKARRGFYRTNEIGSSLYPEFINQYFSQKNNGWQVKEKIKNMVIFKELNLALPFEDSIGKFDLIFCRNVIIYFSLALKKKIISRFYHFLNPAGALILGASENLYQLTDDFTTEVAFNSTYYVPKKKCIKTS